MRDRKEKGERKVIASCRKCAPEVDVEYEPEELKIFAEEPGKAAGLVFISDRSMFVGTREGKTE